jgi:molybdate transport system substrate-binding protein
MRIGAGIGVLVLLALFAMSNAAGAAEIRVYSTGAPSTAAKAIAMDFSSQTGHRLTFTVAQPARLRQKLAAGDEADIVILPAPLIARLATTGTLRADSIVDLARVGVGVVVRDGATPPDISNTTAIRGLLLKAQSIVYPDPEAGGGYAGRGIAQMIDAMGLADAVKAKLTLKAAISGGVELVANGGAEVGFFNISEILPTKGVTLVGPLPAELQHYIVFSAAIPVSNTTPEAAASFITTLSGPAARQAWANAGLEAVTRADARPQ